MARCLTNLGAVLHHLGRPQQAVELYRDALAMRRRLYPAADFPDGHPALVQSLNNLGVAVSKHGRRAEGLAHHQEALELAPATATGATVARRTSALPPVRRLARELGVDLTAVQGTGSNNHITREDVLAERYARGEITVEEFRQRRSVLRESR